MKHTLVRKLIKAASCLAFFALTASSHALPAFEKLFGGSGNDTILAITQTDTAYFVTGITTSPDFPATDDSTAGGDTDVFVAKISLDGTLIAVTRLGGSGVDFGNGIFVDSTGLITVSGWTTSSDFPTMSPIQAANGGGSDCLILQFDSSLVLQFATYLGGAGEEQFSAVTRQPNLDRLVFVGFTTSTQTQFPFPTPNGANADVTKTETDTDGLVVAMAPDRSITLATYHGISGANEILLACDADESGASYRDSAEFAFTGYTDGDFFKRSGDPLGSGNKLIGGLMSASTGARLHNRLRSGNGDDQGNSIIYVANPPATGIGTMFVCGSTTSTDFPVSGNAPQATYGGGASDGLMVAFEAGDIFVTHSTYLGGTGLDTIRGLARDPAGHLHITGTTGSADFPLALAAATPDQATYGGGNSDGFTGRYQYNGNLFGPATASFPALSFAGNADEEGFLAITYRPDGQGADPADPYFSTSAGARLASPPPGPIIFDADPPDEEALITAQGESATGADIGVEIRNRFDTPDPLLPTDGVPIELELFVFNNGPGDASDVTAKMEIDLGLFDILSDPLLIPASAGTVSIEPNGPNRDLVVRLPSLGPVETVVARVLVRFRTDANLPFSREISFSPEVRPTLNDPNLANNFIFRRFLISDRPATADLDARLLVTSRPTPPGELQTGKLELLNEGQHIAAEAIITISLRSDLEILSITPERPVDSGTLANQLVAAQGIARNLRPGETAEFNITFRDLAPNSASAVVGEAKLTGDSTNTIDPNPFNNLVILFDRYSSPVNRGGRGFLDRNNNQTEDAGDGSATVMKYYHTAQTGQVTSGQADANGEFMASVPTGCGAFAFCAVDGNGDQYRAVWFGKPEDLPSSIPLIRATPPEQINDKPFTLHREGISDDGKPQIWVEIHPGVQMEVSEDLKAWNLLTNPSFVLLLNPETFGALEEATVRFIRAFF